MAKKQIIKDKSSRMQDRSNRLSSRANKIIERKSKGSTGNVYVINGQDVSIKGSVQNKRSSRLLGRASVLNAKSIKDPFEKARYISSLPEGKFKDKVTRQGPVKRLRSKRSLNNLDNPTLGPIKR